MTRKLVTIEKIREIKPIEGADQIEAARVRDWWVVIRKGEFKVDSLCMYFEIDSFLPVKPEYDFLLRGSRPKRMMVDGEEREGIRLKTIRLRGQVSQGLAMPLPKEPVKGINFKDIEVGTNITSLLDVVKFEAPIPGCLTNVARGNFPDFLEKTDEERIQNCSQILDLFKDTKVYITEKLDGTSATYYKHEGEFGACSRNMDLKKSDSMYWKIAEQLKLEERLPDNLCIQGEIIGEGIQKNPLKQTGQNFYLFNIYDIKERRYHSLKEIQIFCNAYGINMVPLIKENIDLNFSVDELLLIANNKSELNPKSIKEGIVVRSMIEKNIIERNLPTRLSFKVINNSYLLEEK